MTEAEYSRALATQLVGKPEPLEVTLLVKSKTPMKYPHYYTVLAKDKADLKKQLEDAKESFRNRFGRTERYYSNGRRVSRTEYEDKLARGEAGLTSRLEERWKPRSWTEIERGLTIDFKTREDKAKYEAWKKAIEAPPEIAEKKAAEAREKLEAELKTQATELRQAVEGRKEEARRLWAQANLLSGDARKAKQREANLKNLEAARITRTINVIRDKQAIIERSKKPGRVLYISKKGRWSAPTKEGAELYLSQRY